MLQTSEDRQELTMEKKNNSSSGGNSSSGICGNSVWYMLKVQEYNVSRVTGVQLSLKRVKALKTNSAGQCYRALTQSPLNIVLPACNEWCRCGTLRRNM